MNQRNSHYTIYLPKRKVPQNKEVVEIYRQHLFNHLVVEIKALKKKRLELVNIFMAEEMMKKINIIINNRSHKKHHKRRHVTEMRITNTMRLLLIIKKVPEQRAKLKLQNLLRHLKKVGVECFQLLMQAQLQGTELLTTLITELKMRLM